MKGSIIDIHSAPTDVIKEIQTILGCVPDGIVGQKTLDAYASWKASEHLDQPSLLGSSSVKLLLEYANKPKSYLKVTKTDKTDDYDLVVLTLEYYKHGVVADSINCCSGQPNDQEFHIGADSQSGSLQPLPEGRWSIGSIQWSNGKDNFTGEPFNDGLGYAKIPLDYAEPGSTDRGDILIHCDYNRQTSPGTAGCLGTYTDDSLKQVIGWLRESDPKSLYVDWGLGTCPKPGVGDSETVIAGAMGLAQATKNEANITGQNAAVRVYNTKQPIHQSAAS